MHAAKCVLDLNRNDLAGSLDFDMSLKTNPTELILIGAYTKQSHTKQSHTKQSHTKQSHTKESKTSKKGSKNSPIQNSPKPFEFLGLNLLAPTELIYAF